MKIEELKRQILAELAELDPADGLSFELIQKKLDEKMLELNHRARMVLKDIPPQIWITYFMIH